MSLTLRRGGSAVLLAYQGKIPDVATQPFADALMQRRFRTIENAASEEVSVGWCTPQDPTGDSFLAEHMDAGPATWLRMRTDRKKLPAEWIALHRAAAEQSKGRPLSAKERRELKDDLTEKLLPRVLPKMGFVDALLFPDRNRVLLLSSSKGARESFAKLWHETFSVPLDVVGPERMGGAAAEKLEPTHWPGGASSDCEDPFGFLGQEFLTWLWFMCETDGGGWDLPDGQGDRAVSVMIDDMLSFSSAFDETAQTMRYGLPTKVPESRAALRTGHNVAKAKVLIASGSRQWTVTIDGETMLLGSVKLPEDAEDCEGAQDRTQDRAANWFALRAIVDGLFAEFMTHRASPEWLEREAVAMREWMRS